MRSHVYPGGFDTACIDLLRSLGCEIVDRPSDSDFSVAPLMTRRLAPSEYLSPILGTLIFHPSALPYRRGADSIRRTVESGERVSASTWFWCSEAWDTGDICEQEVVVLRPGESPGRSYHTRFIPAAIRALERAVSGIVAGCPRRIPQDESLATFDPVLRR